MKTKSLTVRIPADEYDEVKQRKKSSLNEFVIEAVHEKLVREREAEYAAGFESLAGPIDNETKQWLAAQQEAMKHVSD